MTNYLYAILTALVPCSMAYAQFPSEIRIATPKASICVGEPLVLQITYIFKEPQLSRDPNRMVTTISPDAMVRVSDGDTEIVIRDPPVLLGDLRLQGSAGLEYSGFFLLFFDYTRKALIFPVPGRYEVTVLRVSKLPSNTLQITVTEATQETSLAMSQINDPRVFISMEEGSDAAGFLSAHPDWVQQLQNVVEKAGDTVLGKWAAASLGAEYFSAFESQVRQRAERGEPPHTQSRSPTEAALLQNAKRYLDKGFDLDDQFPLREGAVYSLAQVEALTGNAERAAALRQELATKYPYGRYGSLVAAEALRGPHAPVPSAGRLPSWTLGLVALALILAIALVLMVKSVFRPRGPSDHSPPT